MARLLDKSKLDKANSVIDGTYKRSQGSSSSLYPTSESLLKINFQSKLDRTNSVVDEIYEHPKESSSSLYPDFERTLKINFRRNHLQTLLGSLLPFSLQGNNSIDLKTILNAVSWIIELRKIVSLKKYWWNEPLVNISGSELVFEWWHGRRKITVYFSEENSEFIKVWGAHIDNEMEEGTAGTSDQIEALWKWLAS